MVSRRNFIKTSAIGSAGIIGGMQVANALDWSLPQTPSELETVSYALMQQWAGALLELQILDKTRTDDYGGIWCPADKAVHGRVGDAIYPLFYLADRTKDSKYTDAAMLLYRWIERRVSQPDGSWLNEPVKGAWKGTTVFASIAMAEALKNHGALMEPSFKTELAARLKRAGDYIHTNFNMAYGNINYPVTASYGLSLLGTILDEPKFKTRGKELAYEGLKFFTKTNSFLYGEGTPLYEPSKKGCFSIDLGYNVEESLPSLVMYGLLNNDEEVLDAVTRSMQTHMEFMLPDGAWDNSWGTRNFKWTYWGSRTSDGCQAAYALMAGRDPRFYKVALQNTKLMQQCTHNGLLQGGLHNSQHNITPCVHHTFTHIKALATMLHHGDKHQQAPAGKIMLPRQLAYGYRYFADTQTWLIAKGKYRATITGYDREYKQDKNGHATGGAITMLWHELTGPILAGSMNDYQLFEAGNMQVNTDPLMIPLTPRLELKINAVTFLNITDINAVIDVSDNGNEVVVTTHSKLVDKDQHNPPLGEVNCHVTYTLSNEKLAIKFSYDDGPYNGQVKTIVPIISKASELVASPRDTTVHIRKDEALVSIAANQPIIKLPTTNGRMFNYVPGLEAIPLQIDQNNCTIEVKVV